MKELSLKKTGKRLLAVFTSIALMVGAALPLNVGATASAYYSTDFSNCEAGSTGTIYAGQANTDKVAWTSTDASNLKVYDNLNNGICRISTPGGTPLVMQMKELPSAGVYTISYRLYIGNVDANFNVKISKNDAAANEGSITLRFYSSEARFALGDSGADLRSADGSKTATLANLGITSGTVMKTQGIPVNMVIDMDNARLTAGVTGADGTVYSGEMELSTTPLGKLSWNCANRVYLTDVSITEEVGAEPEEPIDAVYYETFESRNSETISHDGVTWVTSKGLTSSGLDFQPKEQEPSGYTVSASTSNGLAVQLEPSYSEDVYEISYYYYMNGTDGVMYTGISDDRNASEGNLNNIMVYNASDQSFLSNGEVLTAEDGNEATVSNIYGPSPDAKTNGRQIKLRFDFTNKTFMASIEDGDGKVYSATSVLTMTSLGTIHWICGNRVYIGRMKVTAEYINPIKTAIGSDKTGNIFFEGEPVSLTYSITNKPTSDKNIEYIYVVKASDGGIAKSGSRTVIAPKSSVVTESINLSGLKYGLYTIECTAKETGKDDTYTSETRFSYVKPSGKINSRAGVNTVFNTNNPDCHKVMPLINAAGFGGARNDISWTSVEAAEGEYAIRTALQDFITKANELDVDVLAIGGGNNPLYTENEGGYPSVSDTAAMAALKEYYRQMASMLSDKVEYFEVINEPNHKMTADDYTVYLKNAYEGIKAGNHAAKVIGVVSGPEDTSFFEAVFRSGGGEYMDIVSCHPYYYNASPDTNEHSWIGKIKNIKTLMAKYGVSKPIWLTEVNLYQTGTYDPAAYTDEKYAEYLTRAFIINEAENAADKVYLYNFKNDGTDTEEQEHNFGIVEAGMGNSGLRYAAKPGYLAMSNYNAMMTNAKYVSVLSDTDAERVYRFKAEDGADLYAAWSNTGSGTLEISAAKAVLYDMYGNETVMTADSSGKISVALGEKTVYLKTNFISIFDSDGNTITDLKQISAGDTISFSGVFEDADYTLVCAVYKDGLLTYMEASDSADGTCTLGTDADMVKVFGWKDLRSLTPFSEALVIQ